MVAHLRNMAASSEVIVVTKWTISLIRRGIWWSDIPDLLRGAHKQLWRICTSWEL